jgi:hypothetical protein
MRHRAHQIARSHIAAERRDRAAKRPADEMAGQRTQAHFDGLLPPRGRLKARRA